MTTRVLKDKFSRDNDLEGEKQRCSAPVRENKEVVVRVDRSNEYRRGDLKSATFQRPKTKKVKKSMNVRKVPANIEEGSDDEYVESKEDEEDNDDELDKGYEPMTAADVSLVAAKRVSVGTGISSVGGVRAKQRQPGGKQKPVKRKSTSKIYIPTWQQQDREQGWLMRFNELKRYMTNEGHCNVPHRYQQNGIKLGHVSGKRLLCCSTCLTSLLGSGSTDSARIRKTRRMERVPP